MKELRVAIVGATGLVGQEFIKVLQQRKFPMSEVRLFASDRSVGKKIRVNHEELEVKETSSQGFEHMDLALFSAGAEVSGHFGPIAARAGVVVVDNSAAFRLEPGVPLVVPEINSDDMQKHKNLIANPNCSTIQMVMVLNPIHRVNPIKRVIVDTYQSVSGTGTAAMEELSTQTKRVLEGHNAIPHVYPHQIAFNLLPEIDLFFDNGYSREEWKLVQETRKIMHAPDMAISATCVRVPVFIGHSEAVHAELTEPMTPEEARRLLSAAPGVKVLDDPNVSLYPHPWAVAGQDDVFVGRIRQDVSHPRGLAMWIVADNIRKGAALNAVQIAEVLLERGWI
ncbi:MAG: aspartate-semialdehyde dehydrogenase [Chloroflexota bacterium]|nr:aspartate-semialdehyde dehydrogenase [Chloroflexota bacterium]